jgi:hypothetical protein
MTKKKQLDSCCPRRKKPRGSAKMPTITVNPGTNSRLDHIEIRMDSWSEASLIQQQQIGELESSVTDLKINVSDLKSCVEQIQRSNPVFVLGFFLHVMKRVLISLLLIPWPLVNVFKLSSNKKRFLFVIKSNNYRK